MNVARTAPIMRLILVLATLSLGLTGCKSACRQLSEKLCECSINSTEKTACGQRAANSEGVNPPTPAQDQHCKELQQQCDCRLIDTPEGKLKCGLSRDATLFGLDAGF